MFFIKINTYIVLMVGVARSFDRVPRKYGTNSHIMYLSVGGEGVEPSRACAHSALNAACLPIPPLAPKLFKFSFCFNVPFFNVGKTVSRHRKSFGSNIFYFFVNYIGVGRRIEKDGRKFFGQNILKVNIF